MNNFVESLNDIGPIPAAFGLILIGGSFMVLFKYVGLSADDIKTGHDIIIAGISFISGLAVASRRSIGANNPTLPADPEKK